MKLIAIPLSLFLVATSFVLAPTASASKEGQRVDLTFTAPTRTVIDAGAPGTSVGDLTVTTGDVLSKATGARIGYYTTNQTTVRADAATKRQIREVDLSIVMRDGTIFATGLIRAVEGAPPSERMRFAVTGGLGAYDGARGSLTHDAVADQSTFAVSIKLLPNP